VPASTADSPNVGNHQDVSNGDMFDSALAGTFAELDRGHYNWNEPLVDFADFLDPQTFPESFDYTLPGSPTLMPYSAPVIDQVSHVPQALTPLFSIPPTPSMYSPRSLISRPSMTDGLKRTTNLILHTLKSYPKMMLHHNTLPPFIHPRLISSNVDNDDMEPLLNCMSLVHMVKGGVKGNKKLFWRNVRIECERLREEVR
jgi:hypothetical protein